MRVQAPILMDHENAGQLRHRLGACVGADGPHEISLDAPVALWGGHGLISGLDPVIGTRDLLAQSIIRHQCIDNRGRGQAASYSLHTLYEGAPANLTVNKFVVYLDSFRREFAFGWFHSIDSPR